jgi:hydrogenase maturation factor
MAECCEERMSLPPGKLPPQLLAALLTGLAPGRGVVVGAAPGEDAAVLEIPGHLDRYLVAASDPVTLSVEPGVFAVGVNANDIAVMGAEPRWLLASVLLPPGSGEVEARSVIEGLTAGCEALGVDLVGGHTEITPAVNRPVVAATMIGLVAPDDLVTSSGGQPGDRLLLAGPVAVEGTAILATEHEALLRARGVESPILDDARALLRTRGISVLPAARAVTGVALPHAMHDPTEGGLLSAAREIALASGTGLRLDADRVPVLPACRVICGALDLDPLALLASGSLLAAIYPDDVDPVLTALHGVEIETAEIGELRPPEEGITLVRNGREVDMPVVERDELARLPELLARHG